MEKHPGGDPRPSNTTLPGRLGRLDWRPTRPAALSGVAGFLLACGKTPRGFALGAHFKRVARPVISGTPENRLTRLLGFEGLFL